MVLASSRALRVGVAMVWATTKKRTIVVITLNCILNWGNWRWWLTIVLIVFLLQNFICEAKTLFTLSPTTIPNLKKKNRIKILRVVSLEPCNREMTEETWKGFTARVHHLLLFVSKISQGAKIDTTLPSSGFVAPFQKLEVWNYCQCADVTSTVLLK